MLNLMTDDCTVLQVIPNTQYLVVFYMERDGQGFLEAEWFDFVALVNRTRQNVSEQELIPVELGSAADGGNFCLINDEDENYLGMTDLNTPNLNEFVQALRGRPCAGQRICRKRGGEVEWIS